MSVESFYKWAGEIYGSSEHRMGTRCNVIVVIRVLSNKYVPYIACKVPGV